MAVQVPGYAAFGPFASKMTTALVPELLAKKRKRDEQYASEKAAASLEKRKKKKANRMKMFVKAEQFVKEFRLQEADTVRMKRVAKSKGGFFVEPEAKLLFVIRTRGMNKMNPKTRQILHLLRLRQVNNGIFLRVNKANLGLLKFVEPYISFGYPSLKSVKDLIYKRGCAKVNRQRIPLTDNKVIEEHLGKHGIICMEDLVHQIYNVGPNFKEATNFLWPFKLSSALGGMDNKREHYVKAGQAGNRHELINGLIAKMN